MCMAISQHTVHFDHYHERLPGQQPAKQYVAEGNGYNPMKYGDAPWISG